jgi:hypothetical protein
MIQSIGDSNLYHVGEGSEKLIMAIYVDDLFITGSDKNRITWRKRKLNKEFDMTDLGPVQRYLGVEFAKLQMEMFLSQH